LQRTLCTGNCFLQYLFHFYNLPILHFLSYAIYRFHVPRYNFVFYIQCISSTLCTFYDLFFYNMSVFCFSTICRFSVFLQWYVFQQLFILHQTWISTSKRSPDKSTPEAALKLIPSLIDRMPGSRFF
jgi:hypothetical protein